MLKFNELMVEVKATDSERLSCVMKLAQIRAMKTIKALTNERKVTLEMLMRPFDI